MRRYILSLIILCIIPLSASTDPTSWWKQRISNIAKEKEVLSEKPYFNLVRPVLNEDIQRTSELITFIEDEISGYNRHRKHFGPEYLEKTIDDSLEGAFASAYTSFILSGLADTESLKKAEEFLQSSIEEAVQNHFPGAREEQIRKITSGIITAQNTKSFAHEMVLQYHLAREDTRKSSFILKSKPVLLEEYEDRAAAVSHIESHALSLSSTETTIWKNSKTEFTASLRDSSAVWKDIQTSINEKCRKIGLEQEYLSKNGMDASLEQALYYVEYQYKLEDTVFNNSTQEETRQTSLVKRSIGLARSQALQKTASTTSPSQFDTIVSDFKVTSDKAKAKYQLSAGETSIVDTYTEKSHQYIVLIFNLKREPVDEITQNVSYRLERFAQYSAKLEKLYLDSYILSNRTIASLNTDIHSTTELMKNEFKYLGYNATILPDYRKSLNKEQLLESIELKKNTASRISNSSIRISHAYNTYREHSKQFDRKLAENRENAASVIAGTELSVLSDTVLAYYNSWKELKYSTTFLHAYRRTFNECYEQLKKGQLPENIETVTAEKSLIGLLSTDAAKKMENEHNAKVYLAKAINRDIVRFNKLKDHYRSKRTAITGAPSSKPLYAIQREITEIPEVTVSTWTMNEKNFFEIDRKAAYLLTTLYRKNKWEGRSLSGDVTEQSSRKITLSGTTFSIAIPEGWEEQHSETGSREKIYASTYDDSTFTVTVVKGVSEKEAVENWISENKLKKVQIGWEEYGQRLYFWNIAKSESNRVSKIYAYTHNGTTILLCGSSKKERYPFFHNRIDTVFKSIDY